MTASRPERAARWALLLAAALGIACAGASAPPADPLQPLPMLGARLPDDADRAGRDAAAAALASDPQGLAHAAARLESLERARRETGQLPTGLLAHVHDLSVATLSGAATRRAAADPLRDRDDLTPELRKNLDEEVEDDPIRLANARLRDDLVTHYGRWVNGVVEPVGTSMTNLAMAPARVGMSLIGLLVQEHEADDFSTNERQALAHWKRFVEENPDDPEAAKLLPRIEAAQREWYETQRLRAVRQARRSLDAGNPGLAVAHAERALQYAPEDPEAQALREQARHRMQAEQRARDASLRASADPAVADPRQRALAVAMLAPGGDVAGAARALEAQDPRGPLADEARFAGAIARSESGDERGGWEGLDDLAERSDADSNMARHARFEVANPYQNPYGAYRKAYRQETAKRARALLLGPLAEGPRHYDLPRPLEWLLALPSSLSVVTGLPSRLVSAPFVPTERRASAAYARMYLARWPQGAHAGELRDWLADYEHGRGNDAAALKYAEAAGRDPEDLASLREAAAEQVLKASEKERRRDVQMRMLRSAAREYEGTKAGEEAGLAARKLAIEATPQKIRVTRAFLRENPEIVGPSGLALAPGLLDGEAGNGELHKDGIVFLGGRVIEIDFLAASGDENDPPVRQRVQVSDERIARTVAQLEEANQRMLVTDPDAKPEPDADRDRYFERARLGLLDHPDFRSNAESTYTYRTMRERYGLVRQREPILPVDLVLKGSFQDLGLGAFPRIRMPKPTPDAPLYR